MRKTILHRIEVCTDMKLCDSLYGLQIEFGNPFVDSRSELGCIDAPDKIPAGSCVKFSDYEDHYVDYVFKSAIFSRF